MNLYLSDGDHLNATYTLEDGTPVYQVATPFAFTGRTATIKKAMPDFEQLAQVDFHTITSSILHMQGQEVKTSDFFTTGINLMALASNRKFVGPDGKEYKWILGYKTPKLVLNDDSSTQVAEFHHKHFGIFTKSSPAFLEISPLGTHMVDLIVITFVYIEKLRSEKEKARNHAHTHPV